MMQRYKLLSEHFRSRKNAFSFIELSIVILIIGIIIAGVFASNALIKKSRLAMAQTLTLSSPVNGIPDSVLWLESSLDKSFKNGESSDTSSLSTWYDIRENFNKNDAVQANGAYSPTYSNSINHIQAVKFNGTDSYFTVDGSVLNNTNYTIFILEQRSSNKSENYFIGDSTSASDSTTNKNLVLGYSSDGRIKHSQSLDNSYAASVSGYAVVGEIPRILSFVHDSILGKKIYVNGLLAASSSDTNHLFGMTTLKIGSSYQGQIGEIAIFARALKDEERQSVEDYLGKKWNSKILRPSGTSSASGGSCVGGTVSAAGCKATCTVPTTAGITDASVSDGSGSLTCDTSNHFTGSLPYSCTGSSFSFTGSSSCSCATGYAGSSCGSCDTANGYELISGSCQKTCSVPTSSGTTLTYVQSGTTSTTCDASGYTGTMQYTCSNTGTLNITTACQLTAVDSPCYQMDNSSNQVATITAPSGKTITSVVYADFGTGYTLGTCATVGSCNDVRVTAQVQNKCIGQTSCTLKYFDDFRTPLGDPCDGTVKKVQVKVRFS